MKKLLISLFVCLAAVILLPNIGGEISASALTEGDFTYTRAYTGTNYIVTITDFPTSYKGALDIPSTLGGYPVTGIGDYAFEGCTSLTSITIPDSVTHIDYKAFRNCSSLMNITIPDSVTRIGYSVFEGCTSLTSITIPDSVISIGNSAFEYCSRLTSVSIPNSVTSIGDYAFYGCTSLTSITFPDSVTEIGDNAFSNTGYANDESNWDSDVLYISNYLLYARDSITNCNIKPGTKFICNGAFSYCKNLKSVTIPDSVTSIGFSAFYYCNSLEKITLPFIGATQGGTANAYLGYIFGATQYANSLSHVPSKLKEVIITSPCVTLEDYAFYRCSYIEHITIPNGIVSIGTSAFEDCSNLKEIVLPNTLTSIGDWAFRDCSSITDIAIPNSILTIGKNALSGCSQLEELVIPFVGQNADGTGYSHFGFIFSYNTDTYNQYKYIPASLKTITITGSNSIAANTFYGCNSFSRVNIFGNVSVIGDSAFENCAGLRCVTIPKACKKIESYAFDNCVNLETVYFMGTTKPAIGNGNDMLEDCNDWYFNSCYGTRYHTYDSSCDTLCNLCNSQRTINHTYTNNCDTSCNVCQAIRTITHDYKITTKAAATSKDGSVIKKCTVCGNVASSTVIKYAKTFKLQATSYTYNGKAKKPTVKVYNSAGKLISSSNYTVSYKNNKNVGKATVTIKFKGKYSGTKTLTFTINPKSTKVSKLTAGKKSLKVNIKKQTKQVTGYEVQYSTSKKFKSAKKKTIKSYKTTSLTLKSLKAKKTYYVRVRTYKTVNGKKYYSVWSTYKCKKTK